MIFKLEVNQGIYIHSEEEGEIILPSDSGAFTVEEYGKTYVVNGEPVEPVSSSTSAESISSTSLGIPLWSGENQQQPTAWPVTSWKAKVYG